MKEQSIKERYIWKGHTYSENIYIKGYTKGHLHRCNLQSKKQPNKKYRNGKSIHTDGIYQGNWKNRTRMIEYTNKIRTYYLYK